MTIFNYNRLNRGTIIAGGCLTEENYETCYEQNEIVFSTEVVLANTNDKIVFTAAESADSPNTITEGF